MPSNRSPFKCASSVVTKFAPSNHLLQLCDKSSLTFVTNKGQQALVKQYDQGSASFCGGGGGEKHRERKVISFIFFWEANKDYTLDMELDTHKAGSLWRVISLAAPRSMTAAALGLSPSAWFKNLVTRAKTPEYLRKLSRTCAKASAVTYFVNKW